MSDEVLLKVDGVVKQFGGFKALDGVTITLGQHEILGLVGPNGSGKTTAINVISGLYKPDRGEVIFQGQNISNLQMHRRAKLGINRTFQIPKPFKDLTALENVLVAQHNIRPSRQIVDDPLEFVGLQNVRNRLAGSLNSGQQKMLDLARALAGGPKLLLLDEAAAGLNPAELDHLAQKLKVVAATGVAIIVVEHLMGFVNELSHRVLVMNAGKEIFDGKMSEAVEDKSVIEVYLGG